MGDQETFNLLFNLHAAIRLGQDATRYLDQIEEAMQRLQSKTKGLI